MSAVITWGITILISLIALYIILSPLAHIGLIVLFISAEILGIAVFLSITAFTKTLYKQLIFIATSILASTITRYTITNNNASIVAGTLLALLILSGITAYIKYRSTRISM